MTWRGPFPFTFSTARLVDIGRAQRGLRSLDYPHLRDCPLVSYRCTLNQQTDAGSTDGLAIMRQFRSSPSSPW